MTTTTTHAGSTPLPATAALVLGPAGATRDRVAAELRTGLGAFVEVHSHDDPASAAASITPGTAIGLVLLIDDGTDVDARLVDPALGRDIPSACTVLVTARPCHDDLHRAIDGDRLAAVIPVPWPPGRIGEHARSQLARWLRHRDPDDPRLALLDDRGRPRELPNSPLLRDLELSEQELTDRLVAALDRTLGRRPRLSLPAGTRLTHQGVGVDGVLVVLSGSVALDRASEVGELRLHHASTGPVVGLLSLTQQRRAFFTARATSDIEVVHISLEQLDHALIREPEVGAVMAAATTRALARRLRRAEQLQVEKVRLNQQLDRERDSLATALQQLESTRLELVESARMATLGELSAGIAHELNNPATAVTRAASFITTDLARLLAAHPRATQLADTLELATTRPPVGTAEQRRARRELSATLGDPALAHRLVAAGLTDAPLVTGLLAGASPAEVEELVTTAELGAAVRNLQLGAGRITDLVQSLRSYARPADVPVSGVDVRTTIDDALHLVAHRLTDVEVVRDDPGTLLTVRGHPGPLGQVWTNLVLNAVEAMGGRGRLTVATAQDTDRDEVVVTITDDGPGIPPDLLPRLFEPRFTTKQGRVRYGLGLGLAISERIVTGHDGTIAVRSEPGCTVVTVRLPGEREEV